MLHEPAVELGRDDSIPKKTRLGIILFFVYLLVYAGFVIIGTMYPKMLGLTALAGLNLAFVYGMGLIILAVVMGIIYHFFCTYFENTTNKEN
jgi:uncharacterized membrane protein (DUF485 family)